MIHDFEDIKGAVDTVIIQPRAKKDNLFEIGTKGFYENPFTEVLAYLLSEETDFKHRSLLIRSFLESIKDLSPDIIESFELELKVQTQHHTLGGNYIDLIIHNSKYVLVFENKLNHWLANPTDDYEADIGARYTHLTAVFFILSYYPVPTPVHWINIIISDSFTAIKNNLPTVLNDKWDFYVQDFLNHYISVTKMLMTKDEFGFYSSNFSKIIAAGHKVSEFISEVAALVIQKFPDGVIKRTADHSSWGDNHTKAVRLYPFQTSDNLVLVFRSDGQFSIQIYYYQNPKDYLSTLHELVGRSDYQSWKEGSVSCFARIDGKVFNAVTELVEESFIQINKMMDYYGA